MEKRADVRAGHTPSELSGKKSHFVKRGKAFSKNESDIISEEESKLENKMKPLYTERGKHS